MQFDMPTIDPSVNTGTQLATWLNSWQDAIESSHAGPARPPYVKAGMIWILQNAANDWRLNLFDGAHDVLLARFDPTTGAPVNQFLPIGGGTLTGNLNFNGAGLKFLADFSSTPIQNRFSFQSNVLNGVTSVTVMPNGTGTSANFAFINTPDPQNASYGQFGINATETFISSHQSGTGTYLPFTMKTSTLERARIDANGVFMVGTTIQMNFNATTSTGFNVLATGVIIGSASNGNALALQRTATDGQIATFTRQTTMVGNISVTAAATTYNTTSDYRLKKNPRPVSGSGAFIDGLEPCEWEWTVDGSRGVGFIAHDAQRIAKLSVTGTKDEVDEDGEPIYQGMMPGSPEIIANIVAELKDLRRRVATIGGA